MEKCEKSFHMHKEFDKLNQNLGSLKEYSELDCDSVLELNLQITQIEKIEMCERAAIDKEHELTVRLFEIFCKLEKQYNLTYRRALQRTNLLKFSHERHKKAHEGVLYATEEADALFHAELEGVRHDMTATFDVIQSNLESAVHLALFHAIQNLQFQQSALQPTTLLLCKEVFANFARARNENELLKSLREILSTALLPLHTTTK